MKSGLDLRSTHIPTLIMWRDDLPVYQRDGASAEIKDGTSSVFQDDSWLLHEIVGKPTATKRTIPFVQFPGAWKDVAKRIAWCMLNIEAPVTLIQRTNSTRTRLSPGSVASHVQAEIWPFIRWLNERDFQNLLEISEQTLRQYGSDVASSNLSRAYKARRLWGPTRFWLYAPYLPINDRLSQPPWEIEGIEELLGSANWSGENKTTPIHPQTMAPLLTWATLIVSNFSKGILSASKQRDMLKPQLRQRCRDGDKERLAQFIDEFAAKWGGIPGVQTRFTSGIATQYIGVVADVSVNVIRSEINKRVKEGQQIVQHAPIIDKPLLFIDGQAIRPYIDYYEVDQLKQLLATACIIVIAYLSGMRSEECRGLQRGCCSRVVDPDGAVRYEVVAKSYKDALDSEGNAILGGKTREDPWHVIEPVAKAIQVMERLHDAEFLFSEEAIQFKQNTRKNMVMTGQVISYQIASFVSWCNLESERLGLTEMRIPEDPAGAVTMRRFRRTLAWFIYRQPAGRISLGIQYGHLQGMTSDGYGSRTSTGLRDLFPMEEAFVRAEHLAEAAERLSEGEFVSGPAAEHYVAAIEAFSHRFKGKYLTVRQAAEMQRDPTFRIFDNGMQPVACCYDSARALCHPDRENLAEFDATPNLSRCDLRCPNVARTDAHIEGLHREIEWQNLQAHSKLVPEPLRLRHQQRALSLAEVIDKHEQEKRKKEAPNA